MRNMLILSILLFASNAAATDIVATYKQQDGSMMTIVTRDKDHVRMNITPKSYTLLKDNKVYSVSQDDNGQWMVTDLAKLTAAASSSGFASLFGGGEQAQEQDYSATYKKTGKKEKIAGYTGIVYNIEVKEGNEIIQQDEVVLSSHSDLKELSENWSNLASKMGESMGDNATKTIDQATKEAREAGYGGMLRYGNEMRLHSLQKKSLNISYYDIPEDAQYVEMGQMPNFQQPSSSNDDQQEQYKSVEEQYGQQETSTQQQEQQSQASQALEQDAKDVGQAARQETKKATIDEVQEGVKSLFNSLFN
jgi:hypothetical protein